MYNQNRILKVLKAIALLKTQPPKSVKLLAKQLESQMLHILKKKSARFVNKMHGQRFSGYSEAWTKQSLNVTSIKQILAWVYEDDSSPETEDSDV